MVGRVGKSGAVCGLCDLVVMGRARGGVITVVVKKTKWSDGGGGYGGSGK